MRVRSRSHLLRVAAALIVTTLFVLVALAWREHSERERFVAFYETVEMFRSTRATSRDVVKLLGEPQWKMKNGTYTEWHYNPGIYKGRSQRTAAIVIDNETQLVVGVGYIWRN